MSWLANLKKWIDGEDVIAAGAEPRPRSKWEDFLVAVAREVDQTMQREMFTPPGGPTYIPREYIVFLSSADDADWQGEKREGLERGLHHVLSERARELVGDREFQTKTFTVELRVDAALEPAHFRVQHVWDSQAQKTMVRARKPATVPAEVSTVKLAEPAKAADSSDAPTVKLAEAAKSLDPGAADDEATVVRPRKPQEPVYSISVRRKIPDTEPTSEDVRPVFKKEITIGRGSKTIEVDLKLEGDLEISRKHATLIKRDDGVYTITCHGANSIEIIAGEQVPAITDASADQEASTSVEAPANQDTSIRPEMPPNREVPTGESADVKPGEKIVISTYELEISE